MFRRFFFVAALLLGGVCFAQFQSVNLGQPGAKGDAKATWSQIGQAFVATTIDGQTIDLQSWIDSGYSVVIDYSCCWCGPCWNLHQAGVLEGFYNRFGPNGTNELRVLWIEVEETNTLDQIYGTTTSNTRSGLTQGDWTLGGTFPIPIIDDHTTLNTCASIYTNAVPFVAYIEGYTGRCRAIYGESDGISSFDTAACNANMAALLATRPVPGSAPRVEIVGPTSAFVTADVTFTASIGSVDPVTDISWTFEGATTPTAQGTTATTSWAEAGTYTVTLSVANANGTGTASATVTVNTMGNPMTYFSGEVVNSLGIGGQITWGVKFPAYMMEGRSYVKNVEYYSNAGDNNLKVTIYKGGETSPATEVYSRTVSVPQGWSTINMSGAVPIDQSQSMWVALTSSAQYPMTMGDYCGVPDGSYICYNNTWSPLADATGGQYNGTWAIRVTTGDEPNVSIAEAGKDEVKVFPNPATDFVTIDMEGVNRVEVLDVTGRTIASTTQNVVDMKGMESGVYIFRIVTDGGVYTQRVVRK